MAGISVSLLRVDDERLKWLDAPAAAPAWPNVPKQGPGNWKERVLDLSAAQAKPTQNTPKTNFGQVAAAAISHAAYALSAAEEKLSELDRAMGDGDLGANMARAANALREAVPFLPLDEPAALLQAIGRNLQRMLGGSSGPLYGVFFLRAGSVLENGDVKHPRTWAAAVHEGCEAISELGGARLGDSTMLDALVPFAHTLQERTQSGTGLQEALLDALEAAREGAEHTTKLTARRGRASYLGRRSVGHPDPGAVSLTLILEAMRDYVVGA
jgi:dihydroxyacetone kinase